MTEPERFQPLHPLAEELLRQLEDTFDVVRTEGYGFDPELERNDLARPTVRLVPSVVGAASITMAFTTFPGLGVRFGLWHRFSFPSCGCDACDEIAEHEFERLERMCRDVTAGRYRETLRVPVVGSAWQEHEFWGPSGGSGGRGRLDRSEAQAMIKKAGGSSFEWLAWEPRPSNRSRS